MFYTPKLANGALVSPGLIRDDDHRLAATVAAAAILYAFYLDHYSGVGGQFDFFYLDAR